MAQGEAVFAEQTFGVGTRDAGPEYGLAGHLVDPDQLVEATQIE